MAPSPVSIKVNALKRLIKEETIYRQEVAEQELHVAQIKAANADEYEVRKQQEVLEEAHRMVPELAAKIQQHREALAAFLQSYKGDEDVAEARALV